MTSNGTSATPPRTQLLALSYNTTKRCFLRSLSSWSRKPLESNMRDPPTLAESCNIEPSSPADYASSLCYDESLSEGRLVQDTEGAGHAHRGSECGHFNRREPVYSPQRDGRWPQYNRGKLLAHHLFARGTRARSLPQERAH